MKIGNTDYNVAACLAMGWEQFKAQHSDLEKKGIDLKAIYKQLGGTIPAKKKDTDADLG